MSKKTVLDELETAVPCMSLPQAMDFQKLISRYGPELVQVARAAKVVSDGFAMLEPASDNPLADLAIALQPFTRRADSNLDKRPE